MVIKNQIGINQLFIMGILRSVSFLKTFPFKLNGKNT